MVPSFTSTFSPRTHRVTLQIVGSLTQWRQMRKAWNALFATACNPSPPLHFDWLTHWWEVYGRELGLAGDDSLRIICIRRDDQLIAGLPLYLRRPRRLADGGRVLCLMSTGEAEGEEICPDYLDLLCRVEDREVSAALAWEAMGGLFGEFDRLHLLDISRSSPLIEYAPPEMKSRLFVRGDCPIADLSGGFESYLVRLSANTRQQARRLLRAAAHGHLTLDVAESTEQAQAFFDELIQLHQLRWTAAGRPGCFSSRRFTEFHRRLLSDWHASGRAMVSRLRSGHQTLAVKYGFVVNRKYDFYQSGIRLDHCFAVKSPGIVSFLLLMQHLVEREVEALDFLRGASDYKLRLATTRQPLMEIRYSRPTWRSGVGAAADICRRARRKAHHWLEQLDLNRAHRRPESTP